MHFYNDWALRILKGQWTDYHAFYGLPLYAYLLAAFYKLFGYSPFVPGLIQGCLDAGTAVLLYKLAVKIFKEEKSEKAGQPIWREQSVCQYRGKAIGVLAAAGWALFQPAQAYSAILMPTTWLVFVFWFVVWQIVNRERRPGHLGLLLLGALIGFTSMGVATVLFIIPLLIGAIYLKWEPAPRSKKLQRTIGLLVIFLGVGLGTSPAWLHNYFVAHDPVVLSAHSGVNFWIGNNPLANGYPKFPPGLHAGQEGMLKDSITEAETVAGHPLKRSEVSAYWSTRAKNYIRKHPWEWLKLLGRKTANFWNAFQYDDLSIVSMLREEGVITPGFRFGLVAALAIPGLLIAAFRFPLSRWVFAAVLLHMGSLLMVFVTERYRIAAVPGLVLVASFTVWELWENCARANHRRVVICAAILLAATWFVSSPQKEPGLWALDAYNSGWQALQQNNLPLARKKLELAYAYVQENSEINFSLGNLRFAEGDHAGAKAFYSATLRLNPQHKGALNNLGVVFLSEQHWNLAADCLVQALRQDPRDAKAHYLLAQALLKSGNYERARDEIGKALELQPSQSAFRTLRDEILKIPNHERSAAAKSYWQENRPHFQPWKILSGKFS